MDGPGTLISAPDPHAKFFNSMFSIWLVGKHLYYGCFRPIIMHEVWRDKELKHQRLEQLSILHQEEEIRWARVVPGKMSWRISFKC